MKPQDLRIGNYVRIKESGEIVQVCAITKHKIGFHAPNERPNAHLRYRNYSEIEPVLIREVYDNLPYIKDLEWRGIQDEDVVYYFYTNVAITDLHHLQNIHYALTGNEIEIEI